LGRMWKQEVVPDFKVECQNFPEGIEKVWSISVKISGVRTDIQTWDLSSTKQT